VYSMGMPSSGEDKKTIAIRVSPELRGRLDSLLQITGGSVNDAGIEALEKWIAGKMADPEVRAKALEGLVAEERALQERRRALEGLVDGGETPPSHLPPNRRPSRLLPSKALKGAASPSRIESPAVEPSSTRRVQGRACLDRHRVGPGKARPVINTLSSTACSRR
jgi:predicted DNA-binding protein